EGRVDRVPRHGARLAGGSVRHARGAEARRRSRAPLARQRDLRRSTPERGRRRAQRGRMRASRTKGEAFLPSSGIPVLVERDDRLPLVDISVDIRLGKLDDPEGLEGLSRLYALGLRSGPQGTSEIALANR